MPGRREPRRPEPPTAAGLQLPVRSAWRRSPIGSERLALVPIQPEDAADLFAAIEASRWHLERWLPWVPFTVSLEATLRYAEACVVDWDTGRALRFCLRERASSRLVGVVSLDTLVHLHRSCELGYWLSHDVTGKGLMREAAATLLGQAFGPLGLHRVRCAAATDNHASLRVISHLGFTFEGISRQAEWVASRWLDHAVFARLSTDVAP
ncbi:MAG: GNAT family N-acetyltransferase [Polyangiaceae bacterium]|nr:GNAT family N-acetyltransferase [Polyangiaceae bacterium]